MTSVNKVYVARVTQLDSVELDKEILQVLKAQVSNVAKVMPGSILDTLEPEINALLKFSIWKLSVHQAYSTFGQQLLSLHYDGKFSKNRSFAWCFLTIVPSYIKDRLENNLSSDRNGSGVDVVHKTIKWIHVFVKIAVFSNLLMFLRDGEYPSIIERILRMRHATLMKQQRTLGYGYMTRELLWHTLIGNLLANADFECPSCGYCQENLVALPVPFTKPQYEATL